MKNPLLLGLVLCFCFTSVAFAKRSPPKEIAPVRSGELEFRVSHGQMGCVEAWDVEGGKMIWRRQIYVVKYQVDLERDVQDVFIESIELKGGVLLVKNERKSEYRLDLETLEVAVVKGALVERS